MPAIMNTPSILSKQKIGALSACLLMAFSLPARADLCESTVSASDEQRLDKLEKLVHEQYNQSYLKDSGPFIRGDVFYWTARETGTPYAIDLHNSQNGSNTYYQIKNLDLDWNFGFRGEIGYDFKRDGWGLGLCWTHLFTRAKDRGNPSAGHAFIPIWSNPHFAFIFLFLNEAEAKWHLHYNQLDLALGRAFYISKYLVLRPFMGPSGLWIDQSYSLEYERPPAFFALIPPGKDKVRWESEFTGVGANVGCDIRFGFRYGWSIYGKADAGIYYGRFHIKQHEKYISVLGLPSSTHQKHNLHIAAPTLSTALGLRWDHTFSKGRNYIAVQLLWEHLIFFSQNQLFRFITPDLGNPVRSNYVTNQGDLTLQGGTISVAFGF